jgi:aryl-alcohol dehydrogenase-like predicted oxidoreductase
MNTLLKPGAARLGFGCAGLAALARPQAVAMLDAALDLGITHLDTARMYGWGEAESILGEVAARRRHDMIIVTKAGIAPPSLAGRIAGKLLGKAAGSLAQAQFDRFAPAQVLQSLEASLAALRTDYVDALLLHEVKSGSITDELLRTLDALKAQGKVRAVGLATSHQETARAITAHPGVFTIIQLPAADLASMAHLKDALLIGHSVLSKKLNELKQRAASNPEFAKRLKEDGYDPSDDGALARLLLEAAIGQNPTGVTLFSSSKLGHLQRHASLTRDSASDRASALLAQA